LGKVKKNMLKKTLGCPERGGKLAIDTRGPVDITDVIRYTEVVLKNRTSWTSAANTGPALTNTTGVSGWMAARNYILSLSPPEYFSRAFLFFLAGDGQDRPGGKIIMLCQYAIDSLKGLRENLQEAAEDSSLLDSTVNAGLILHDICECLGLFPEQRLEVLGPELEADIQAWLDSPVILNLEGLPVVA
jgi:hypothetical protein